MHRPMKCFTAKCQEMANINFTFKHKKYFVD